MYNFGLKFFANFYVFPTMDKVMKYLIKQKSMKFLDKEEEPCERDSGVKQWKECVERYFDKKAGCRFPWDRHPRKQ